MNNLEQTQLSQNGEIQEVGEEELDAITGGKVDAVDFAPLITVGALILARGGYKAARQYLARSKVHPESL